MNIGVNASKRRAKKHSRSAIQRKRLDAKASEAMREVIRRLTKSNF